MRFSSTILRSLLVAAVAAGLLAPTASSALSPTVDPPIKAITITPQGNQMKFEETNFSVQPGQKVKLTFENTASSPAMKHNVVVLNTSDDAAIKRVGQAAMSASNYVPDDPAVLAATDVAKPGDTVVVTFTAPDTPGEYGYICTFPGHYVMMQGTMTVTK